MELKVNDIKKKYALKPDIKVGNNYYFQWNVHGFGLADTNEINSLKNFIRKLVPLLEQFMKFLQTENVYNAKDPFKDKKQLCIVEKHNKKIFFVMTIDSQGSTLFYREEKCSLVVDDNGEKMKEDGDEVYLLDTDNSSSNNNNGNNSTDNSINEVELKWLLGELLFDRQKKQ